MVEFEGEVDFFALNVDESDTVPVRQELGLMQRAQYILIGASGAELKRWIGPLNAGSVTFQMESSLAELE